MGQPAKKIQGTTGSPAFTNGAKRSANAVRVSLALTIAPLVKSLSFLLVVLFSDFFTGGRPAIPVKKNLSSLYNLLHLYI